MNKTFTFSQSRKEIPTRKNPNEIDPIKDPDLSPNQNNPINPQNDEPSSPKVDIPEHEPNSPGYDENEGRDIR